MLIRLPSISILNPATQLGLWMTLAITALNLASPLIIGVSLIAAALAWVCARLQLVRLLTRSRWLLLSVALVFVLMTPASGYFTVLGVSVPGTEGLRLALDQISRLVLAMAMLALLLKRMDMTELVAGVRQLLVALHLPGVNPDRAALRLILTLQRLEQKSQHSDIVDWRQRFAMDEPTEAAPVDISIPVYPFGWADKLILIIAVGGGLGFFIASPFQATAVSGP